MSLVDAVHLERFCREMHAYLTTRDDAKTWLEAVTATYGVVMQSTDLTEALTYLDHGVDDGDVKVDDLKVMAVECALRVFAIWQWLDRQESSRAV